MAPLILLLYNMVYDIISASKFKTKKLKLFWNGVQSVVLAC